MKKLLLILICLFVSFEVTSKEQKLICKSNILQQFTGWGMEMVNEIDDETFWIVVLNKKKKYLMTRNRLPIKYKKSQIVDGLIEVNILKMSVNFQIMN